MPTALITGPTSGIGNAFARRLAADGWDLVLVARYSARLDRVADELRAAHRVDVEVLPADLSVEADRARVAERIGDRRRPVDLMVNNAGFAVAASPLETTPGDEASQVAVLVQAVLQFSTVAAQAMAVRGHGGIINVSSVAGFVPTGSYGAAKAWVTNYSASLAPEVRPRGVRVVVTCPGFTRTEFQARAGIERDGIPGFLWLSAEDVVDDALEALRRGRVVTVPGLQWKVITALSRHLPVAPTARLVHSLTARVATVRSNHATKETTR